MFFVVDKNLLSVAVAALQGCSLPPVKRNGFPFAHLHSKACSKSRK